LAQGKLTRKEIVREDVIRKTLTAVSYWLLKNRVLVTAAIVAFLLLTGGYYLTSQYLQKQEDARQHEFSDALAVYHAPVDTGTEDKDPTQQLPTKYRFATETEKQEAALARFRELSEKHQGKKTGYLARYYTGLCLLDLDRREEAKTAFEDVESSSAPAEIRNLARNSLAQMAFDASDYETVIGLFRRILEEQTRNVPAQMVRLALGRALELTGQLESALEEYRTVSTEYAGTSASSEAQARIRKLEPRLSRQNEDAGEEVPAAEEEGEKESEE